MINYHTFLISQIFRLEVQSQDIASAAVPLDTLGENASLVFPAFGSLSVPWKVCIIACLPHPLMAFFPGLLSTLSTLPLPHSYRVTCHWIWSHLSNTGWFHLKSLKLITSVIILFPNTVTSISSWGQTCLMEPSLNTEFFIHLLYFSLIPYSYIPPLP